MSVVRFVTGLASALLLESALLAQAQPAPGEADIVVTGERPDLPPEREVTRQAREITQATGLRFTVLPRFEGDRLCPGVFGLKADFAAAVIDRIRANARRFDLWMTKDDGTCRPNFVVAFVDDGQATLRQIAKNRYWLFKDMPRNERIELLADDGPVHVWTTTQARTRGGMPLALKPDGRQVKATVSGGIGATAASVRDDIVAVLILFDRDDTRDKSLVQIADYATMRGLARTRPVNAEGQALATILALFDKSASPPHELTAFDGAYLGALYAGDAQPGLTTIGGVSQELRREGKEQPAETGR